MVCVGKNCVYAIFLVGFVCAQSVAGFGKGKEKSIKTSTVSSSGTAAATFQWAEHKRLSWDDFRGDIKATRDEVAAATHCGIGFKTNASISGDKPEIVVYNLFYTTQSWVKPDAKLPGILEHEQGHFDLCEIYTRKLRERLEKFDLPAGKPALNEADLKLALINIYNEVSNEYEARQDAYEQETTHGTNISAQKRWQEMIAHELGVAAYGLLSQSPSGSF